MLHHNSAGEPCALVSNVQKYTIHDGPGIRTSLFFTGCTMRCLWCSNPETISPKSQLGAYPAKCLSLEKCGLCLKVCPEQGRPLVFDENGVLKAVHMTQACDGCFRCADVCPPRALKRWGELMTIPQMLTAITEDRSFYQRTGGGVTLNGGEVLVQWEIAAMLLEECKKTGINTCVETALNVPWAHAEAVFRFTDLVITDIKHMDAEKHREYCGAGNALILENIRNTAALGKKLVIRTPVIPGYNGGEENIRATGAFIKDELDNQIVQYQLLPYRKMGTEKYDSLGIPYPMGDYQPPERVEWEQELLRYADLLAREYGIPAAAGSSSKLEL
jgi:pyruvate formate lyase activating enzyme